MSELNCSSCADLREHASDFVVNGVTDTVCASLKNNTGFNPSADYDDCEDLDLANDCLVGNMVQEIEAYDVCEWKPFMRKFLPNVWNVLKSIICALCGLWTKVECLNGSVNDFASQKTFAKAENITFLFDWHSIGDPSIGTQTVDVTVDYNAMHGYSLVAPGPTAAAHLNSISAGQTYLNTTIGGNTYLGYPIFTFTGNIRNSNIIFIRPETKITTEGTYTYGVYPLGNADAQGNVTMYASIRSKIAEQNITEANDISLLWNVEVRRKLDFDC